MPENIPNPKQVAARVQPRKPAPREPQKKGWHATAPTTLEVGDLVRTRLGGNGPTYKVESIDAHAVRLSVYSTVGVGKVPSRTLDPGPTAYVWKWF